MIERDGTTKAWIGIDPKMAPPETGVGKIVFLLEMVCIFEVHLLATVNVGRKVGNLKYVVSICKIMEITYIPSLQSWKHVSIFLGATL